MSSIIPVILAGGSGTRLWPLSRGLYPKQFMDLGTGSCLFEAGLMRATALKDMGAPIILARHEHRFLVAEILQRHGFLDTIATGVQDEADPTAARRAQIILEPEGRNTAPAIAVAALAASAAGKNPILLVLPADHLIKSQSAFSQSIASARKAAEQGKLLTFGVVPDHPATGYGYILRGAGLSIPETFEVSAFVEKPSREKAGEFLRDGRYLWNSGMFMFTASAILAELAKYAPAVLEQAEKSWKNRVNDLDFVRLESGAFKDCPAISLDYAVMEKTGSAAVAPLKAGWSDLGSWDAFYEASVHDESGNSATGDVLLKDCAGSYVHAGSRLVAGIGLKDLLVVESPDAVLVAAKGRSQEVRDIMAALQKQGRAEASTHLKVHRPWGSYETLVAEPRFLVKRIIIKPDRAISLQLHHHRAEHWVVVSGTAKVLVENRAKELNEHILTEDMSIYVPLGSRHMLTNPGPSDLELIEVQSGDYLGEDDIIRFADMYGREDDQASSHE